MNRVRSNSFLFPTSGDLSSQITGWGSRTQQAGMPVHSGTAAVERTWSLLQQMLPDNARRLSVHWFNFLSALAFLRMTYSHFNSKSLPSWTSDDSLLAQRVDGMLNIAAAMGGNGEMLGMFNEMAQAKVATTACEEGVDDGEWDPEHAGLTILEE